VKPTPYEWIVTGVSFPFVALVTWLDAVCFFELGYGTRLLGACFYLLSVAIFLRNRWSRVIAASSLTWLLVILPGVRWNYEKSFYVDARSLTSGMAASEVRQIMKPYLEVSEGGVLVDGEGRVSYRPSGEEQQWQPWAPYPGKGMIFLHSVIGWTDHCEVRLDPQGRVQDIEIEKD